MRQRRLARTPHGFGLLPFRSPLLRESSLFLGVLRCFSSPGALPAMQGDGPSRPPGCPIRRSRDHRVPAPPPRISPRGRVLPRLQAPRHPPCAHLRGFHRSADAPPSPTRAITPVTRVVRARQVTATPPSFFRFSALVRASSSATCVSGPPLRRDASALVVALGSGRRMVQSAESCQCAVAGRWSRGDSNPGPPPCKGGALPAKLRPLVLDPDRTRIRRARWARLDSNQGPRPYQGRALTS